MERRVLGGLVVVVALALTTRSNFSADAKDVSASGKDARVAEIIAAWTKRENAIHNVKATLEEHIVLKPALLHAAHPHIQSQQHPKKATQEEYTVVKNVLLDFVGNRYRVDTKGGIYDLSLGRVMRREMTSVFVDGKGKTYWHNPEVEGDVPKHQGMIDGRHAFTGELMVASADPLIGYSRPASGLDAIRRVGPDDFEILSTKRRGSSRIVECAPTKEKDVRFELDSSRDYVPVGKTNSRQQMTIEYGPDEGYGPIPRQSTNVSRGSGGAIKEVSTTRFLNIETNVALTDSMFEFEFPEGTVVDVAGRVQPPLTAKAHGRLVPSQDIQGGSDSRWRWGTVWIGVANAVVVIMLALVVLRRRFRWG